MTAGTGSLLDSIDMDSKLVPSLLATFMVLSTGLAGCSDRNTDPPILVFEEIRYWFEDDLVVFNITIKNTGNWTPHTPRIGATLTEWRALAHEGKPGEELKWITARSLSLEFADWNASKPQKRYYEDAAAAKYGKPYETGFIGPVSFPPNENRSFELVFLPEIWFEEKSNATSYSQRGYYTIEFRIPGFNFETKADIGEDATPGCFSHDWPEFYGLRSDGADCVFYNRDGDYTETEYPLQKGLGDPNLTLGSPIMIHDPPEGVEGAH